MIIGIDGNEANVNKKVGISEFSFQLLKNLKDLSLVNDESKNNFRIYLKNNPTKFMPQESSNWQYRVLKPGKFWTQWRLPLDLYLRKPRPDVFFSTTHYAPRFSPIPVIISIMDLSYLYYPEMFKNSDLYQLRNWTNYSAKKASMILTISSSTKSDIIREYKIEKDKIKVIYPGIKPSISHHTFIDNMDKLKSKHGLSNNYILFVGTLQPRKNIIRLIEAFALVLSKKNIPQDLQLIIIGKKGWLYEEILQKPSKLNIEEKVKFLNFIKDEELAGFYKSAICFVLPSLYEGFGLPVLEAMKNECPVITSDISSLPEAGGDAALYVDPENVNEIAEKMYKLVINKEIRHEMIQKGKKQVAKFSWEKSAKETLKVLEEIGSRK